MAGFCMSGAATRIRARVRVRSPSQHYKKTASFIKPQDKSDGMSKFSFNSCLQPESESGNRVMVVVDSSPEAKVALQWALSHTVQSHDTIILLHVAKQGTTAYTLSSKLIRVMSMIVYLYLNRTYLRIVYCVSDGKTNGEVDQTAHDLLRSSKNTCQQKRPEVSRKVRSNYLEFHLTASTARVKGYLMHLLRF